MSLDMEMKLIRFAIAEVGQPFAWGYRDCGALALRALDAMTGGSAAAGILRKYDTKEGALSAQERFGKIGEILRRAGALPAPAGFERTGDFLLAHAGPFQAAHVYLHGKALSAHPDHGVRMFPLRAIKKYTVLRVA